MGIGVWRVFGLTDIVTWAGTTGQVECRLSGLLQEY